MKSSKLIFSSGLLCIVFSACNSANTGDHESKHDGTPPGSYSVSQLDSASDSSHASDKDSLKQDNSHARQGQNASGNKTNYSSDKAVQSHNASSDKGKQNTGK